VLHNDDDNDESDDDEVACIQLLMKAPNARLGCSVTPGEEREIKDHLFYRNINWQKLEDRQVQPPFKPKVVSILHCTSVS